MSKCNGTDIGTRSTIVDSHWVVCHSCGASGPSERSIEDAINSWSEVLKNISVEIRMENYIFSGEYDDMTCKDLRILVENEVSVDYTKLMKEMLLCH